MPIGYEMIGGIISVVVYSIIIVAVYKVFQIATDLGEMKDILRDIRRNTDVSSVPPVSTVPQTPEALVRAVNQASYSEVIEQATRSEQPR